MAKKATHVQIRRKGGICPLGSEEMLSEGGSSENLRQRRRKGGEKGENRNSVVMEKAPMVSAGSEAPGKERKKGHQRERGAGEETSCGKELVRESVVIDKLREGVLRECVMSVS